MLGCCQSEEIMNKWWAVALGGIFGLLSAGVILLASQPPRGNAITLLPPPTPIPIQVHINGEVKSPGVYALPSESRVQDAISAAGGFTAQADDTSLNLAASLQDGSQIQVPNQTQAEAPLQTSEFTSNVPKNPSKPTTPSEAPPSVILININTASLEELETLSGIGPVTAEKIIAFREENGAFTSIEEIQKVSGIGPATYDKIKAFITVTE
jgi:competence protein ComEA